MLVYRFPFRPEAAGQAIQIHRSDGTVVDSGVVPSEVDVTGVVAYEAELPEGNYYVTGATPGWDGVSGPVGVLDVPSSIEAGGGGGTTTDDRGGTLYLKGSVTGADASTQNWGTIPLVLDTAKQGSTPIPGWASEDGGVYSVTEAGAYVGQIAGIGSITYPEVPTLIGIDIYHNDMSGVNWGWYSDGSDDSPAFTPQLTTPLDFGIKDSNSFVLSNNFNTFPTSLASLVGDNEGDLADGITVDLDVRLAVRKIAAGARYTEADFA